MSVVGVDLGTLNTVIAVARNRGVDVVCISLFPLRAEDVLKKKNIVTDHFLQITNEVSNRATP